jgi:hypothetical protein
VRPLSDIYNDFMAKRRRGPTVIEAAWDMHGYRAEGPYVQSADTRLRPLQDAVSDALRTGRIDDHTWEKLQAALVTSHK